MSTLSVLKCPLADNRCPSFPELQEMTCAQERCCPQYFPRYVSTSFPRRRESITRSHRRRNNTKPRAPTLSMDSRLRGNDGLLLTLSPDADIPHRTPT